jgi:endonuclease YncB( thermonuclease family)
MRACRKGKERRLIPVAVSILAILSLSACNTASKTSPPTTTQQPRPPALHVARVIDGDTLDLDNGDRIRLVQIDAPEAKGECYGKKAGRVLSKLLPVGTEVHVVRDPRLDNIDRYGRKLRYVFNKQKNINLVLVQKGAASVWYFQGDKGQYADQLLTAAKKARRAGRGAWGVCVAKLDPSGPFQTRRPPPPPVFSFGGGDGCDPSYPGACLKDGIGDYDCAGGGGDGPNFVEGPIQVRRPDPFRLDSNHNGTGCESG